MGHSHRSSFSSDFRENSDLGSQNFLTADLSSQSSFASAFGVNNPDTVINSSIAIQSRFDPCITSDVADSEPGGGPRYRR